MVTMAAQTPTSAECVSVVHSLMCHRQGQETESFAKRAIESLVKKLIEKRDELDSLILAITTNGTHQSKCATIQRTLDGRLQVAGRKGFPHVIFARLWRWPDLHKNELRHIKFCKFAFDLKQDSVCINPYHYERVVSPGFDLSGLSLHNACSSGPHGSNEYSSSASMHISDHARLASETRTIQHLPSDSFLHIPSSRYSVSTHHAPSQHFLSSVNVDTVGASSQKWPPHSIVGDRSMCDVGRSDSVEYLSSPHSSPAYQPVSPSQQIIHRLDLSPSSSSGMSTSSSPMSIPLATNHASLASEMYSRPVQNQSFLSRYPEASGATWIERTPCVYSQDTAYWSHKGPAQANITSHTPLSNQLPPKFWCKQTYFELDQQVGETFKVPYNVKTITIDGYTDPSCINRFCLGQLSNVNRTETSERARLHIGKGVQLDYIGDGDVWIRCIGNHSVFVQSFYLDRQSRRPPGDAVHKIFPSAYVKIFDMRQCYHLMHEQVATAHAAGAAQAAAVAESIAEASPVEANLLATTGIAVDDLRRICLLRFSFVKGWGPDYNRKNIKETPCWVEIQLDRPLQLLDEVLHSMPNNDIQPRSSFLLS